MSDRDEMIKMIKMLEYLKKPYSEIIEETPEISDYEQMKRVYEITLGEIEKLKAKEIEAQKEKERREIMWGMIFFMEHVSEMMMTKDNSK